MQDKVTILAPAKINIFIRVLGKTSDGYHAIRSGITFINLFDEVSIKLSDKMRISYSGYFQPKKTYNDCIVKKTLNFINNDRYLDIEIKKNIPVQGGLGSASTNAAALIKGLNILNLIKKKEPKEYVKLGADIPCFLYAENCLAAGIGERLYSQNFPKYYFLLIKPNFSNSTKDLYSSLGFKKGSYDSDFFQDEKKIVDSDRGNDFESIVLKKKKNFRDIMDFLENLDDIVFVRMTGSGSCCYAAFDKKDYALSALKSFKLKFPDLWSHVFENNIINN